MKDLSAQVFRKVSIPTADLLMLTDENYARNSIRMSLCTNRRSTLPHPPSEASGWWADEFTPSDGIGSSLFTLARAKQSEETLDSALYFAQEALEWIQKADPHAEVEVDAQFEGQDIKVSVDIRGSQLKKSLFFEAKL